MGDIHKIERINQRALHYIYDDHDNDYFNLLNTHNAPTMYLRRIRAICCEIYKTLQGTNATYMKDLLAKRPSPYPSRTAIDLFVPKVNQKTFGYNSFKVEGPTLWNMIPRDIRESNSIIVFKSRITEVNLPWCKCEKCLEEQMYHILSSRNNGCSK